jgi:hypothetical protein
MRVVGGSQTPWTSNIETAGYVLLDNEATPGTSIDPSSRYLASPAGLYSLDWSTEGYVYMPSAFLIINNNGPYGSNALEVTGNASNAAGYFTDSTNTIITQLATDDYAILVNDDIAIDANSKKLYFGSAQNASICYDGSDLIISSQDSGFGVIKLANSTQIGDGSLLVFGTDADFSLSYNQGNDELALSHLSVFTGDFAIKSDIMRLMFGASSDASIYYDGTNLVINPKEIGSGYVDVQGGLEVEDGSSVTSISTVYRELSDSSGNRSIDWDARDLYDADGSTTRLSWTGDSVIINTLEVRSDGTIKPISLADASAPNDSIYYSTTQSKLVYKDSGGTVNNLY